MGLAWSKADRAALASSARALQSQQRKDGGWSQLPSMPSDAAYQAGLRFLLDTQAPDGTWHVKARALPIQLYFESGYPYAHDQWISSAGAAYATMAIAAAIPRAQQSAGR